MNALGSRSIPVHSVRTLHLHRYVNELPEFNKRQRFQNIVL